VITQQPHVGIGAQVAPHAAVGLLIVAAAATHAVASATGHEAATAAGVAAVAFTLAVLVAMKRGTKIRCRKARARLVLMLLAAAGWLTSVTATGLSWGAVEILALTVTALSLHWWRAKRIDNAAPAEEVVPVTEYAERWAANVGGSGGALVGSMLVNPERIDAGVRYTLLLVPGKQEGDNVHAAMKKIRGALSLHRSQYLIIEPHPTLPEPHQRVTIVTTSPVREEILWPGAKAFKDGRIDLGPFADGIGTGQWVAYVMNRLMGGYLQGGTNGGKSRTMESIAVTLAMSDTHPTVIWFIDGQGYASSPKVLGPHADHKAGTLEACVLLLKDALRVVDLRQEENDLEGWSGFTPRADRPGLLIFMDECHKFMADLRVQAMVATIAREGGKVGVAMVLASQSPLLDAFGGSTPMNDAETVRSNLLMGNGLVFRSESKDVQHVFGIPVSPVSFPVLPGYCMLVRPPEEGRSAPLRAYHFTDAQADEVLAALVWRELDPGSANAAGPNYLKRKQIALDARAAKKARVAALRAGRPLPVEQVARPIAAPAIVPATYAFPVWDPAPVQLAGARVADAHLRVAAAVAAGTVLRAGFTMPHIVARELDRSERWAHDALKDLVQLGILERPAGTPQGRYYPTGKTLSRRAA